MSVAATGLILGVVVLGLVKTNWVRPSAAVVCAVFGLVVGAGPAGPPVSQALNHVGDWAYTSLQGM